MVSLHLCKEYFNVVTFNITVLERIVRHHIQKLLKSSYFAHSAEKRKTTETIIIWRELTVCSFDSFV